MTSRLRIGRMTRWQRRTTYVLLGLCAATGLVWFLELDVLNASPSQARPWWVSHGLTAVLATMCIGGAAVQHVVVTWRAARSRWAGTINLALLLVLVGSALYLMYGPEPGHDLMHWAHALVGIAASVAFVWHVLWGRKQPARALRTPHHPPRRPA